MFDFFKKPNDLTPGIRGSGKRVRSRAPGIEGVVLVPSASASIASAEPMSEENRKALLDMAKNATPRPILSQHEKDTLAALINNVLQNNPELVLAAKANANVTIERVQAELELLSVVRSDSSVANFIAKFKDHSRFILIDAFRREFKNY